MKKKMQIWKFSWNGGILGGEKYRIVVADSLDSALKIVRDNPVDYGSSDFDQAVVKIERIDSPGVDTVFQEEEEKPE